LGRFFRAFNRVFQPRLGQAYERGVTRVIGRKALMLVYATCCWALTGLMFKAVPGGFVPRRTSST
jgi:multidrug efflux pump